MNVKEISIDLIKPYWRNPRKHEKTVAALKESIRRYGFNQPLLVDKDYTIICGHARYKAMRELGFTEIPVVISDMDSKKAKEYRIADNKIAELSQWDPNLYEVELREIYIPELDLMLDIQPELLENEQYSQSEPMAGSNNAREGKYEVDENDIEKAENRVTEIKQRDNLIPVTCPHCGADFTING